MAKQTIGVGSSANDGTGDTLRTAGGKINSMFTELYGQWRPYRSGRKYPIIGGIAPQAGGAAGNGQIRFTPFFVMHAVQIDTLYAFVTTVGSSNAQLAIYASDSSTLSPTGNALASTGNIVNTSLGEISGAVTPVTLQPGLYWAAANQGDASCAISSISTGPPFTAFVFGTTGALWASGTAMGQLITFASAFNTWPDMTSNSVTVTSSSSANMPLIAFKVA